MFRIEIDPAIFKIDLIDCFEYDHRIFIDAQRATIMPAEGESGFRPCLDDSTTLDCRHLIGVSNPGIDTDVAILFLNRGYLLSSEITDWITQQIQTGKDCKQH